MHPDDWPVLTKRTAIKHLRYFFYIICKNDFIPAKLEAFQAWKARLQSHQRIHLDLNKDKTDFLSMNWC